MTEASAPPRLDVKDALLYDAQKKSTLVALLLWLVLGLFGAHRFYLAKPWVSRLLIAIAVVLPVGYLALEQRSWSMWLTAAAVGIGYWGWILLDAFRIPAWVRSHNLGVLEALERR